MLLAVREGITEDEMYIILISFSRNHLRRESVMHFQRLQIDLQRRQQRQRIRMVALFALMTLSNRIRVDPV